MMARACAYACAFRFNLFAKRLERGRFLWPSTADGVVTISPAQLGYLLEGIDWTGAGAGAQNVERVAAPKKGRKAA